MCVRENACTRETERVCVVVFKRERVRECVLLCLRERKRVRERERETNRLFEKMHL